MLHAIRLRELFKLLAAVLWPFIDEKLLWDSVSSKYAFYLVYYGVRICYTDRLSVHNVVLCTRLNQSLVSPMAFSVGLVAVLAPFGLLFGVSGRYHTD